MITLFYSPGACSLAPHIALLENGLTYQLKKVDLSTHTIEDGAPLTTVNPKNSVPVLQIDDQILSEAAAILFYIAEHGPHAQNISVPDAFDRYRLQEALTFVSSEFHKGFGAFFNKAVPEEYKVIARERLQRNLNILENILSKQEYISGDQFTVADAYCFTVLRWIKVVDSGLKLSDWPHVLAYYERILNRPLVKQALAEESITKY